MKHILRSGIIISIMVVGLQLTAWADAPEDFVLVRAGTFTMGSPEGENRRDDDETQHTVTISRDFYMSKYEVTQGEYESVMGNNPSSSSYGIGDDYPVNNVTWFDAVEYCNKLSKQEDLTPAYTINGTDVTWNKTAAGYRLPTEAEWEYADRGGHEAGDYNIYAGSDEIDEVAWYGGNSGNKTHPVGGKQANELGLYDMSGNVFEWCWDWYDEYPTGSVTDPIGSSSGDYRVARGGCWLSSYQGCRAATRAWIRSGYTFSNFGFRLVLPSAR